MVQLLIIFSWCVDILTGMSYWCPYKVNPSSLLLHVIEDYVYVSWNRFPHYCLEIQLLKMENLLTDLIKCESKNICLIILIISLHAETTCKGTCVNEGYVKYVVGCHLKTSRLNLFAWHVPSNHWLWFSYKVTIICPDCLQIIKYDIWYEFYFWWQQYVPLDNL